MTSTSGPEVAITANELALFIGASVISVVFDKTRQYTFVAHNTCLSLPAKIQGVFSWGIWVFVHLSDDTFLMFTLAPTGRILFYEEKFTCSEFTLIDGIFE